MVVTSDFVAINEISVQVVQFHIAFPHIFPTKKIKKGMHLHTCALCGVLLQSIQ